MKGKKEATKDSPTEYTTDFFQLEPTRIMATCIDQVNLQIGCAFVYLNWIRCPEFQDVEPISLCFEKGFNIGHLD